MENTNDILSSYNSPAIEKRLSEIRDRKGKNAFLESIMSNPNAEILNETNGHKTILFSGNKGPKTITWEQTKQMAFELNHHGYDVAFLPELTFETSADCLIKIGNNYRIADFKYCITSNPNTIAKDLKHGFEQANTIVLKLQNIDSGMFKDSIEYLLRNGIPYGEIILLTMGKLSYYQEKSLKPVFIKKEFEGSCKRKERRSPLYILSLRTETAIRLWWSLR